MTGLTQRQLQILQLRADGLTDDGIADALGLSVNTIKTLLKLVYRRLGARNGAHAVALGFHAGLLKVRRRKAAAMQDRR